MDKLQPIHPYGTDEQWGMRAQFYAAIHLKVTSPDLPDWLNKMIDRSRKDDYARAAMQALISETNYPLSAVCGQSHEAANAMMEESK